MTSSSLNPLEEFLRDYIESVNGLWDEVEPQVYDLLFPESTAKALNLSPEGVIRTVFDPEALLEHPGSQFMTFGTPLLDGTIKDAQQRGRFARAYLVGLNLQPYELSHYLPHALDLPEGVTLELLQTRALHFKVAVFWFSATFVSDQKEQELFQIAIDLYYGRQVRHLEKLLDPIHLTEAPVQLLPDVSQKTLAEAYRLAHDRTVRRVAVAANQRRRELANRYRRQEAQMITYYRDLREEVAEQIARAKSRSADPARALARRQAIDREEKLRLAELQRKNILQVHLCLMNLLEIRQPKLLIESRLTPDKGNSTALALVWDPLIKSLEAPACPQCTQPTFVFRFKPKCSTWLCQDCAARPLEDKTKKL